MSLPPRPPSLRESNRLVDAVYRASEFIRRRLVVSHPDASAGMLPVGTFRYPPPASQPNYAPPSSEKLLNKGYHLRDTRRQAPATAIVVNDGTSVQAAKQCIASATKVPLPGLRRTREIAHGYKYPNALDMYYPVYYIR